MTATDHLNGVQFMSTAEIGRMASQYDNHDHVVERGDKPHQLSMDEAYRDHDMRFAADDELAHEFGGPDGRTVHSDMTRDIAARGIQKPIRVRRIGDLPSHALGHYTKDTYGDDHTEVYDGHHRYFAGRDAGLKRFPVTFE